MEVLQRTVQYTYYSEAISATFKGSGIKYIDCISFSLMLPYVVTELKGWEKI